MCDDDFEKQRIREDRMRNLVSLTEAFAVTPQKDHGELVRMVEVQNPQDRGREAATAAIAAFEQLEKFLDSLEE